MDDQTSDPNPITVTVGDTIPDLDGTMPGLGVYPMNQPMSDPSHPGNSKHGLAVWANSTYLREDFDYKVEYDDQRLSIRFNHSMKLGDRIEIRRESHPPAFLKLKKVR